MEPSDFVFNFLTLSCISNTPKMKQRLLILLLFHLTLVTQFTERLHAQGFEFSFHLGQYDHQYYLNGEFNDIITETSNTSSNLDFLFGFSVQKKVLTNLELQIGINNYTTFVESMAFWDTTEDQFFGDFVRKGHTFGARTYSFPIKIVYPISLVNDVQLTLGTGIEYFHLIDSEPIGNVNLGRQHARLNDFLPRIDGAYFRNGFLPLFCVGIKYRRFGFELQTRINPKYSFSTFEFEGEEFQADFWRKISSFNLSYNFLKLGK